jgi:DNA-binding response OmpR family regulator
VHHEVERPIIFLSSNGSVAESVQAMKAGAIDVLPMKPINPSELKAQRRNDQEGVVTAKLTRREAIACGSKRYFGKVCSNASQIDILSEKIRVRTKTSSNCYMNRCLKIDKWAVYLCFSIGIKTEKASLVSIRSAFKCRKVAE